MSTPETDPDTREFSANVHAALRDPDKLLNAVCAVLDRHAEQVEDDGTVLCAWCEEDYPCVTVLDIHGAVTVGFTDHPRHEVAGEQEVGSSMGIFRGAQKPTPSNGNAMGAGTGAMITPQKRAERGAKLRSQGRGTKLPSMRGGK